MQPLIRCPDRYPAWDAGQAGLTACFEGRCLSGFGRWALENGVEAKGLSISDMASAE